MLRVRVPELQELSLTWHKIDDYAKGKKDDLFNFAVDLLPQIRPKYHKDWNSDWKNELFLGDICYFTILIS